MSRHLHHRSVSAFVLHSRAYLNTSCLLSLFTYEQGKVTLLVKGGKRPNYRYKGSMQPFVPLKVSYVNKGTLPVLTDLEFLSAPLLQRAEHMYCGLYLNELIYKLWQEFEASPRLFEIYRESLLHLGDLTLLEPILRHFEKVLLEELGYGLDFKREALKGANIVPDTYYRLNLLEGFSKVNEGMKASNDVFKGENLLAIARHDFTNKEVLQSAKKIMRAKLQMILGSKTINARYFFTTISESKTVYEENV